MALTKVTHNVLESRYTAASALSSAAAVTVDSSAANVFTVTAGHSITFNFTNVKIGDVKTIIVTGGGGSYTLTLGTITQKMYELFTYLRHKNSKSKL